MSGVAALARRWGDPLVGVLAAGLSMAVILGGPAREGPVWANVLACLVFGGLLAGRGRAPVPTAYGFAALLVVFSAFLTPPATNVASFFGLLLFAYTAGGSQRRVLTVAYPVALMIGIASANLAIDDSPGDWIFPTAITAAAYVAGRSAVYRSALAAELVEATQLAEEAQAVQARRAVDAERRRIAREMHDVVAHSISVMVVQAGGARRILERDAGRAEQAAAHIERTGRETLAEMRRLLGVMHGGEEPAELEPSPTLDDLAALCRRVGATLRHAGEPQSLSTGMAMAAYRIVQEALEAGAREAEVTLAWSEERLELRVIGAGRDLPGVRERVALYDGEVSMVALGELVVSLPLTPEGAAL